jgi:hypothetical protein
MRRAFGSALPPPLLARRSSDKLPRSLEGIEFGVISGASVARKGNGEFTLKETARKRGKRYRSRSIKIERIAANPRTCRHEDYMNPCGLFFCAGRELNDCSCLGKIWDAGNNIPAAFRFLTPSNPLESLPLSPSKSCQWQHLPRRSLRQ